MAKTKIAWTDESWNPITGCTKVSEGCANCYAEKMAKRLQAMGIPKYRNGFEVTVHTDEFDKPLRWKKPRMVFVCSMSDLFHGDIPSYHIITLIDSTICHNEHTYQILTKRPLNMERIIKGCYLKEELQKANNIWLGVSAENQKRADIRIPILLNTPAAVRWVSLEPLLERIDLTNIIYKGLVAINTLTSPVLVGCPTPHEPDENNRKGLDWVVIGCESGPKRRPCKIEWVEDIVQQCKAANTPVFVKQLDIGGKVVHDINKFPEHLRVRQYPERRPNDARRNRKDAGGNYAGGMAGRNGRWTQSPVN